MVSTAPTAFGVAGDWFGGASPTAASDDDDEQFGNRGHGDDSGGRKRKHIRGISKPSVNTPLQIVKRNCYFELTPPVRRGASSRRTPFVAVDESKFSSSPSAIHHRAQTLRSRRHGRSRALGRAGVRDRAGTTASSVDDVVGTSSGSSSHKPPSQQQRRGMRCGIRHAWRALVPDRQTLRDCAVCLLLPITAVAGAHWEAVQDMLVAGIADWAGDDDAGGAAGVPNCSSEAWWR